MPYPPDKPLRPKTDNECDEADDFPQDMDEADNEWRGLNRIDSTDIGLDPNLDIDFQMKTSVS